MTETLAGRRPKIQYLVTIWDLPRHIGRPSRGGAQPETSAVSAFAFDTEQEARSCYEEACERVRAGTAEAACWSHEKQNLGICTAWGTEDEE